MIYFEDLEVGAETLFGHYDVTREEVLDFARKYDPQPFHLSDEEAAKTHFGRIAASGWHTTAMTMAVIARHVGFIRGVVQLNDRAYFELPIRAPGTSYRVSVTALDWKGGGGAM
jgi:acyl dehydratase